MKSRRLQRLVHGTSSAENEPDIPSPEASDEIEGDGYDERELVRCLELVHDESSFLDFLAALRRDREDEVELERELPSPQYGPGANGWENSTIEDFLDGAEAWARDKRDDRDFSLSSADVWNRVAVILYAGKRYE